MHFSDSWLQFPSLDSLATMFRQLFLIACLAACVFSAKPNIVFLLTDDQDLHMNSLDYMYGVQNNLVSTQATV